MKKTIIKKVALLTLLISAIAIGLFYLIAYYDSKIEQPIDVAFQNMRDIYVAQHEFKYLKIRDENKNGIGEYAKNIEELNKGLNRNLKPEYGYKFTTHLPETVEEQEMYYEIHLVPVANVLVNGKSLIGDKRNGMTLVLFANGKVKSKYNEGKDIAIYKAKDWEIFGTYNASK